MYRRIENGVVSEVRSALKLAALLVLGGILVGCSSFSSPFESAPESASPPFDFDGATYLRGVNVYSLFASRNASDDQNIGEPQSSYDYLAARGLKIIRLAVPWERLQPLPSSVALPPTAIQLTQALNGPIDQTYLGAVADEVAKIDRAGMRAVIDLHAGCRYPASHRGSAADPYLQCGDGITNAMMDNVWRVLSSTFKNDQAVAAYDIMNEPYVKAMPGGMKTYISASQSVVDTIRAEGDDHVIWVESPNDDENQVQNTDIQPWIHDPIDHVTYSEHFYPAHVGVENQRFSPVYDEPILTALTAFANWCHNWAVHCSIGEIGWPSQSFQAQWPGSYEGWNQLGEQMYEVADRNGLDVTYFAAQSSYTSPLIAYDNSANEENARLWPLPGINQSESQASVIEAHPSK